MNWQLVKQTLNSDMGCEAMEQGMQPGGRGGGGSTGEAPLEELTFDLGAECQEQPSRDSSRQREQQLERT